jgi:hypothetical protein
MIAVLLFVLGCVGAKQPECVDNGNCHDGQACVEQTCQDVECLASIDCAFGNYCDLEESAYECRSGCASNDDCPAGEECNLDDNECEAYGCRNTDLDCGLGQFCDEDEGECYDAEGEFCTSCDDDPTDCGDSTCFSFNPDDRNHDNYCLAPCRVGEDDCPRGYDCVDVTEMGDYYCFADCTALP